MLADAFRRHQVVVLIVLLLLPIVPFLILGTAGELWFQNTIEQLAGEPTKFGVFLTLVLAADMLLPVPSGPLMVLAGQVIGCFWGSFASWCGLNLGAVAGFFVARSLGKRVLDPASTQVMALWMQRYGKWLLIITRPIPIFAEACVLFAGAYAFPVRSFLIWVSLANFVTAVIWTWLGSISRDGEWSTAAIAASLVIPILLAIGSQRFAERR